MITQALTDADMTLDDMDAIAVTYGPGLVGALLVGVAEAKALPMRRKSRWWAYIISRDISVPILSKTKNWSRRLSVWWCPAAIPIW